MLSELNGMRSRSTRGSQTRSKRQTAHRPRSKQLEMIIKLPKFLERKREQRRTRRTTSAPKTAPARHLQSSKFRRAATTRWAL